ncbi:MAG: M23 family metallopeptidase [Chloroflexi bacterium]|nr:M23 family metallopeptidase [Chloroflexota bacterium]
MIGKLSPNLEVPLRENSEVCFWQVMMKKVFHCTFLFFFTLSACSTPTSITPTDTPVPPIPTLTQTPVPTATIGIPTFTATPQPDFGDHPAFLAWPLPARIGLARISQYPNTPWTWNYLGLNEGYQCPPMFGYLELSYDYWRDISIPIEQDQAQADPHNFQMIECYTTGGAVDKRGHEGTDIKAPADTPVYAVADGKIAGWRLNGLNSMMVLKHCPGGDWDAQNQCSGTKWYTTYMHLVLDEELFVENLDVAQGDTLGAIYNQGDNSHLHFEVGLDKRSYENFVNPWGRDKAPWLGCMWLDQSLCPFPDPNTNRVAFLAGSSLSIRQGGSMIAIRDVQDLKKIWLWKDRIALLDSQGRLFLRDGRFNTGEDSARGWILFAENVGDFGIADRRAAILDVGGNLFVNETNQPAGWIRLAENVRAFSISNQRVGYLTKNGELYAREGSFDGEWIPLARGVSAFQLTDNRIAIADSQGSLFVNEGEARAEWKQMAERVQAFQLTNLRVGVLDAEGNLQVKEGNLRAEWVRVAKNVISFQLSNYRMVVRGADGTFKYQEGNLYQPLSDLPSDLQSAVLNDEQPVFLP